MYLGKRVIVMLTGTQCCRLFTGITLGRLVLVVGASRTGEAFAMRAWCGGSHDRDRSYT
jgi:hypothetical protein